MSEIEVTQFPKTKDFCKEIKLMFNEGSNFVVIKECGIFIGLLLKHKESGK